MANKSISQLTAGGAVSGTDLFPDVQTVGVGPVKVTASQLATYFWFQPTLVAPNIGNATGTSLTLGTQSSAQGSLVLANTAGGSYSTTIKSSNSAAAQWTLTLPTTSGTSGYVLTTDGSGNTAWSDPTIIGIDINVGTTAIVGGTSGGIIWNNAGFVGNTTAMSTDGSAALTLGTQQTTQGSLVLANTAAGAYSTTIKSSNSATASATYTLPVAPPASSGYVLSATTAGVMSWTSNDVGLAVGSSTITGGSSGRVLYDNAGVLGEYTVTGTAGSVVLSTTPTFTSSITLGTQQTTRGSIILANTAAGAFPVTLQSSNSTSAAWTMTLPTTAGTNTYLLTTDGSGNMSWTNPSTIGGLPGGSSGQIQYNNSSTFGGISAITTNGSNTMTFGTQQVTQGAIVLANTAAGSFSTTIQSSNSASAAWTLTLPTTAGTNGYVLTTNGSGVTSWAAAAGATITNDTTTNATEYPIFANATSGSLTTAYTSNANLTYNPSTGTFLSVAVGSSSGVVLNANTISVVYSIPSGYNAFSSGPVTVASGGSITVPAGSNWTVV